MSDGKKTLAHLMAEKMAESRFTEMMASAGVGSSQMALQLMFYIPRDFRDAYEQLWYKAFAGKDDGGVNARGQATAEAAVVGKASGKGLQGLGGAKRKTYKRYWVIADEHASDLKSRVDKRLRALAREIEAELAAGERVDVETKSCPSCGRRARGEWTYCPFDGASFGDQSR
jgi:hypothetical protein